MCICEMQDTGYSYLGELNTFQTSNLKPQTSNLKPQTSNLKPQTSNLKPQTSNLKPQTSNLKPQTSNLKPQTSNLKLILSVAEGQTSNPQPLHHLLHQLIRSRTILNILLMHVHIIHHLAFWQMRKAGTIGGPDLVNRTFIILKIQELAGFCFIKHIAGTISAKPLFGELPGRLSEVFGDTYNIGPGKGRAHRFTAIGTGKTIYFFPNFRFQRPGKCIQSLWRVLFDLCKKCS